MHMCYRRLILEFLSLAFVWQLSPSGLAQQRETQFARVMEETIEPWFAKGQSGFLSGTPSYDHKIDLRYHYFLHPRAQASIVIVHGLGERIEKYKELAYDFYQAGYHVFLYDQRGFGHSTRLQDSTRAAYVDRFAMYAQDLDRVVLELVKRVAPNLPYYIFAHSMGGAIAATYAREHQEAQAIVLSAPMLQLPLGSYPHWFALGLATLTDALGFGHRYAIGQGDPLPRPFAEAGTESQVRWDVYNRFIWSEAEQHRLLGGVSFRWVKESLFATQELRKASVAQQIRTPILLFQAEKDDWVDNRGQNEFCRLAPACELVAVPDARHEIYRERDSLRGPYLEHIQAFFRKHARPQPNSLQARP